MVLPVGVTTATVIAGVPVTHTGAPVKAFVTVEPSAYLVHAATGTPLVDFLEELDISEGVAGQFILPHTDQAGFIDSSGAAYTNWYYTARVTYSTPSKAKTKPPKVKVFQLTTGQSTVDLDLLPEGAPALPYIAPTATVTAFGGRTGPVVLEESDLPERLTDESLNATYGPTATQMTAAFGPTAAAMLDAFKRSPQGTSGKKYAFIAGVIRNNGSGSGYWQPITDTGHQNTNFGTVTTTTDYINIDYTALAATKVVSLVAVADDTFVQAGIVAGTSVGSTEARIYLSRSKPYTDYLSYVSGTGWVSASGKTTVTAPEATNTYQFNHPDIGNGAVNQVALTSADGVFIPGITGESGIATKVNSTCVKVQFRDYAGTLSSASAGPNYPKFYLSHGGSGALNPQGVDTTAYPGSNIWVLGIVEV